MNVTTSQPAVSNSINSGNAGETVQEFSIKVPKNSKKKFNVMRFNSNLNVDFTKWSQVKMERENNKLEKHITEELPKYGAGSEYRREEKEEARKKRLGYAARNYNPDDQPWILKCGGKNGKKFRGIREGGVSENAAYYIFMHGNDGSIEAYPVSEWYNFQPVQRFKALSAEEAEQEFGKRNKSLNYFSLMMRKRFRKDEEDEADEEGGSKIKKNKGRDLKISDMDEWIDSDDDDDEAESNEDRNGSDDDSEKKNRKKKEVTKKTEVKNKAKNSDESAFEESDDGDEEGRECDYISDSSEDISDHEAKVDKEMKSVAEEDALRKLLTSDEEEEEEKKEEEGNKSDQEEQIVIENPSPPGSSVKKKRKKESPVSFKSGSGDNILKTEDTSSEFSADSSDTDSEKPKTDIPFDSQTSVTAECNGGSEPALKKLRLDLSSESSISEEAVRRYLTRKPMTATELLQKFKKPRTNLSSEQLVNEMTRTLKKINPIKQMIKNKMYLSLKPENVKNST